jgi:hypothetical protein
MKQNNYSTIATEFNHVNQEIDRSHEKTINSDALYLARSLAVKNFPQAEEEDLSPFVSSITSTYAALKNQAAIRLKGALQKYIGSIGIANLTQKIEVIKAKIAEVKNVITNLLLDKQRIETCNKVVPIRLMWTILTIFGLAEVLFNVSSFTAIGDIFIVALIVGGIIGFAQVFAAKSVTLAIRDTQDPVRQKQYLRFAIIGFCLFSLALGAMRYYLVHTQQTGHIPFWVVNPITFAIINLLLIFGSALVVYRYYPSRNQEAQLELLDKIERDIKKASTELKELETAHDSLLNQKTQALQYHGQVIFDQQKIYEKIDNYYQVAVGVFKNENVTKRSDNLYPKCFRTQLSAPPSPQTDHFTLSNNKP